MKSSSSRSNGERAQSRFRNSDKSLGIAGFGLGGEGGYISDQRFLAEFFALNKVCRQAKHPLCLLG